MERQNFCAVLGTNTKGLHITLAIPNSFFRENIGARYKRIRKRPRGKLSPQLYAYMKEKLQELEELDSKGELMLYYADESLVQMVMFHMAGNSRMRIFTSHPRRQPGLISLA